MQLINAQALIIGLKPFNADRQILNIMKADKFIEIFGSEGYDKRFDRLKTKGCDDLSNGYYIVYDNTVFYQYVDSKGCIYESSKEPEYVIDIDIKSTALKGI